MTPFDSARLAGLAHLRRLDLIQFGLLQLDHLPAALRTLHVRGSALVAHDDDQQPLALSLPAHCW